jgi:hypothetical protein
MPKTVEKFTELGSRRNRRLSLRIETLDKISKAERFLGCPPHLFL